MPGKRQENLLAKIANLLEKPVEEIKEAKGLYSEEEQILEAQSVLNYYEWRKGVLEKLPKETDAQYEKRKKVWQYKECPQCMMRFAYSYHYDGVKYCSLDCLKAALKKLGIELTPYRPLNLRWGYSYPGIVPSSALDAVERAFETSDAGPSEP